MQEQIYCLSKISLIILCALLASAASQDLQNEFNQEEETNDAVNKGFFPSDFWTSREVKVSVARFLTKYLSNISQIDEIGLKTLKDILK